MKKKPIPKPEQDAFIEAAELPTAQYPWQNAGDKPQVFNLRLPAGYAEKLDYLVKGTMPKKSKQHYLLERLLPLLDEEIKRQDLPV